MFPDIFWLTLHMLNKCHPYWDLAFVSSSEKCSGKLNDKNPIAFTLLHCAGKSLSAYNAITFAPRKKDVEVGNGKTVLCFPLRETLLGIMTLVSFICGSLQLSQSLWE